MRSGILSVCAAAHLIACAGAFADAYDPPADYYATATGTGATLKAQLYAIISKNYWTGGATRVLSYTGQTRFALAIGSRHSADPSDAFQVLTYDGVLHSKVWDSGATWNTEHTWPRSRGVGSNGPDDADCHMLRPTLSASNGERGNNPYGTSSGEFDPNQGVGVHYRGECARACFYAATRYNGTETNTIDLELVNGTPGSTTMGDLAELLAWHYDEAPSEIERRRNHILWSNIASDWYDVQVNPSSTTYHQGNRNPFIDHPEWVWTIFGSGPNNSTLYVGGGAAGDGSSSTTIDYGRVIIGQSVGSTINVNRSGTHPTTWIATTSGDVTSAEDGLTQMYPYVVSPPSIPQPDVAFSIDTSLGAPGLQSGTVVIDNTDLSSAAPGKGSADANDTVNVLVEAVEHSNGSFDENSDANGVVIDFGTVAQNSPVAPAAVSLWNLESPSGATADLDVDAVVGSGDTGVVSINLVPSINNPAGSPIGFAALINTSAPAGPYQSVYTVTVSDQNIPGATAQAALTVTVLATIGAAPPSCSGDVTGDGVTNVADFNIVAGNFGGGPGLTLAEGDLTGDGYVDVSDFNILAGDFGCE